MNSSSRFAAAITVRSHRSGDQAAWWTKTGIDPAVPARALLLETHPLPKALDIMDPERATSLAAGALLREAIAHFSSMRLALLFEHEYKYLRNDIGYRYGERGNHQPSGSGCPDRGSSE